MNIHGGRMTITLSYKNITFFILYWSRSFCGVRETDGQKETNGDYHIDP